MTTADKTVDLKVVLLAESRVVMKVDKTVGMLGTK